MSCGNDEAPSIPLDSNTSGHIQMWGALERKHESDRVSRDTVLEGVSHILKYFSHDVRSPRQDGKSRSASQFCPLLNMTSRNRTLIPVSCSAIPPSLASPFPCLSFLPTHLPKAPSDRPNASCSKPMRGEACKPFYRIFVTRFASSGRAQGSPQPPFFRWHLALEPRRRYSAWSMRSCSIRIPMPTPTAWTTLNTAVVAPM